MATQTEVQSELKELVSRRDVHRNLYEGALVEHAIRRSEGRLASNGALVAYTGKHTGRSPRDKFVGVYHRECRTWHCAHWRHALRRRDEEVHLQRNELSAAAA